MEMENIEIAIGHHYTEETKEILLTEAGYEENFYKAEFVDFEGYDGKSYKGLCIHYDDDVDGPYRHYYIDEDGDVTYSHN